MPSRRTLLRCLFALGPVFAGNALVVNARAQTVSPTAPAAAPAPAAAQASTTPGEGAATPSSEPSETPEVAPTLAPGDHLTPSVAEAAPEAAGGEAVAAAGDAKPGESEAAATPAAAALPQVEQGAGQTEIPEDKVRTLSMRSAETQREIEKLVAKQNRIRLTGLNYARYVTWSAASAFAVGSLLAFGTAQDVEKDVKSGDYVGASDRDSDGDVDSDDESHARRISRTMGGVSLLMAAGGVLSSVFYRLQAREMDQLTNDIETLRSQQKRAIFELDYELRASRQGARVGLIVRM